MTFLISFAYILCSIFAVFGIIAIIFCCLGVLGSNYGEMKYAFIALIVSIIITALCFAGKEYLKEMKAEHSYKPVIHNNGEK